MTVAVVAAVLVVLIVCGTLVTRWALKFAAEGAVGETVEDDQEAPPEKEEKVDPAVLSVLHLDGWDEIVLNERRYRKCLNFNSPLRNGTTNGWLHYPEGTPLSSTEWVEVSSEYERRLAKDESSPVAVAARRAWGDEEEMAEAQTPKPVWRQRVGPLENVRTEAQRREEELDRRVEEARLETRKVDKL
jgi:hypothetical protein